MKTRNATISIYRIQGKLDLICDVFYRGELLASFDRRHLQPQESTIQGLKQKGIDWALANGFTGYKLI